MIARVFPRKTKATPTDSYAFIGAPPIDPPENITEVHISVTFTYDLSRANKLKILWEKIAPVKIGGPAFGQPSGEFVPGMYLQEGYTITSRGCPNRCWFCHVWRREPKLIELPIHDGWIIHDDNLLACSEAHIRAVFEMLKHQKHRADFRGLEAKLLQPWHVELLMELKPARMFFAYDTPDDKEPLIRATKMLTPHFTRSKLFCYVLIGYPKDTMEEATERLKFVKELGICPFAMLYRDDNGQTDKKWRQFQRSWCRPAAIYSNHRINPLDQESPSEGAIFSGWGTGL